MAIDLSIASSSQATRRGTELMARQTRLPSTSRRVSRTDAPPSHVSLRQHREQTGLSVSFPDWAAPKVRNAQSAVVLHVATAERATGYLRSLESAGHLDIFVLVPDPQVAEMIDVPSAMNSAVEILAADSIGDGMYQLTSLVNSGRLSGYHTVVRHVDDGAEAMERFDALLSAAPIELLASAVHRALDIAGLAFGSPTGAGTPDRTGLSERVDSFLLRASSRRPPRLADSPSRSISTFVLRGGVVEALAALRVDHQDFYFVYNHYVDEGLATETLGGTDPDELAHVAVADAFFALVDNSDLRVLPTLDEFASTVENVRSSDHETALAPKRERRAHGYAVYHPDLTTSVPERDASWTHIVTTTNMYLGQQLPLAPRSATFADPLSQSDRARQTELASQHGIDGFLVLGSWNAEGLRPGPFFESVATDANFPWALVLRHPVLYRTDPAGRLARSSIWVDPGVDFYASTAARIGALAAGASYLRLNGRPIVVLENIEMLLDAARFIDEVRHAVSEAVGSQPWLLIAESYRTTSRPGEPLVPVGFDGLIHLSTGAYHQRAHTRLDGRASGFSGNAFNMRGTIRPTDAALEAHVDERIIPGAIVGFDSSPVLRSQGTVGYNWNSMSFRKMLEYAVSSVASRDEDHRIVAITSWNGWSELSQLEPSRFVGESYLGLVSDTLYY
ncbi:hypothetical protein BH11ACT2_BH11ACT2_08790 [soil metagenome]